MEAASSTVIHAEAPLDEERSRTPIPDGVGNGVAGSSKVANMSGETVAHSPQSKNADNKHRDDQLEVSQGKAVRVPLEIDDLRPITEPEDSGESNSEKKKKFNPVVAFLPNFNKGTCVASIVRGC